MRGFLLDEHLPARIRFSSSLPVMRTNLLGVSPSDGRIWDYAKKNDLVIVSKDADFSDRIIVSLPPPKVVHLKFGNMRKSEFHDFLAKVWPRIEELIQTHKLVNVYRNRIETVT
jgi:predicted nuclease of predicted toxin-antitoxin system